MKRRNAGEFRFSVYDEKNKEFLSSNHRTHGEAFNCIDLDYVGNTSGLIVLASKNDIVYGETNRKGYIIKDAPKNAILPKHIWRK